MESGSDITFDRVTGNGGSCNVTRWTFSMVANSFLALLEVYSFLFVQFVRFLLSCCFTILSFLESWTSFVCVIDGMGNLSEFGSRHFTLHVGVMERGTRATRGNADYLKEIGDKCTPIRLISISSLIIDPRSSTVRRFPYGWFSNVALDVLDAELS